MPRVLFVILVFLFIPRLPVIIDIIRKGLETDHVLQYIALSYLRAVNVVLINTFLATSLLELFRRTKIFAKFETFAGVLRLA